MQQMNASKVQESRKVFIRVRGPEPLVSLSKISPGIGPLVVASPQPNVVIADVAPGQIEKLLRSEETEIFEDFRFGLFPGQDSWWERQEGVVPFGSNAWSSKTQADVLARIRAPEAWAISRGQGVTIAIVDTGVAGDSGFLPSPLSVSPTFATAWADKMGHGTMCASIAAASTARGARYEGVAPDATLLSARTTMMATDVYNIYTYLLTKKRDGAFPGGLVISNSFGHYVCAPPDFPEGHPYVDLVRQAVREGIHFVFAAGNNHAAGLCGYPATDSGPNTIWATNSIDEVISVGTVNWNDSNREEGEHANSSRGPGDWSTRGDKPDVVAPTYGDVRWGDDYRVMEWWGTSGAAPQVAGLAALLLAVAPALTPAQLMQLIRGSAEKIDGEAACVGAGMIDCKAALGLM